jgi:hypothetical protein
MLNKSKRRRLFGVMLKNTRKGVIMMNTKRMGFFISLLFLAATMFAPHLLDAQEAEIREVTGTVEVQRAGTERLLKAETGMKVQSGDLIITGFKSTTLLKIGDAVLAVRPFTRLTLEEIVQNQGKNAATIFLQSGRVRAEVTPPSGGRTDFTVRSPSSTASVRGDIYEEDGVWIEE